SLPGGVAASIPGGDAASIPGGVAASMPGGVAASAATPASGGATAGGPPVPSRWRTHGETFWSLLAPEWRPRPSQYAPRKSPPGLRRNPPPPFTLLGSERHSKLLGGRIAIGTGSTAATPPPRPGTLSS